MRIEHRAGRQLTAAPPRKIAARSHSQELLRAAQQICTRYDAQLLPNCVPLPEQAWCEVVRLERLLRHAQRCGWNTQQILLRTLRLRTSDLRGAIDNYAARLPSLLQPDRPTLRAVYEDLLALANEFDEVRVDLREKQLSVITPPITLAEVDLGRFEVRLRWSKLPAGKAYEVIALDPNRASSNDSVSHPHVQDEALCEGEGQAAIRSALVQGRLLDLFLLVRQLLETYNPASAYVSLDNWSGVDCSDCGSTCRADETYGCERCGDDVCGDCSRSCSSCGNSLCNSCCSMCRRCDQDYCYVCTAECRGCRERCCEACLEDNHCSECREAEEEELEETPMGEGGITSEDASPEPAVHAVCLGEAGLPA